MAVIKHSSGEELSLTTKTQTMSGPLSWEQLDYVFRPLHQTDLPAQCANHLRLRGMERLADVLMFDKKQLDSIFASNIKLKGWFLEFLEKHNLDDKFGLKMLGKTSQNPRDYDIQLNKRSRVKRCGIG